MNEVIIMILEKDRCIRWSIERYMYTLEYREIHVFRKYENKIFQITYSITVNNTESINTIQKNKINIIQCLKCS